MSSLIKLDGKPLTKLIESVSNGIGVLYKPRAIRKEADAKAYEIKIVSKAKAEAEIENKLLEAEFLDRISTRIIAKEVSRQNNIDDVVEIAASNLKDVADVAQEQVDPDWTSKFFNIVQDISDNEVKQLWGKILSDEVAKPNSYSPRTLDTLRNLSKKEAELFTKISESFMKLDFIFTELEFNISLRDIIILINAGLLNSGDYTKPFNTNPQYLYNNELLLNIETPKTINVSAKTLTTAGLELMNLIGLKPNRDREFLSKLSKCLKRKGATSVKLHEIVKWEGSQYHFRSAGEEIL